MPKMLTRVGFAIVLGLAGSERLMAQATGTINGRVVDQAGGVLPGATVTVTNVGTGVIRETVTNTSGLYAVPALSPGTYDLQAALPSFTTSIRKGVQLVTGSTVTIDFTLQVAQLEESVTVVSQAPLVEPTQSLAASSIRQTEVAQLPMLNRSMAAMMALLPGAREVSTDSQGATHSYTSFSGGAGFNYNMLVDGLDNHEHQDAGTAMEYSLESVEEFKTQTSGFSAEYGKAPVTVVMATKSGTNQVRGSIFGYGRNASMTATDYFSKPENGGLGKQPFKRLQLGGSVGGPLVKDRAWYFASVERVQQDFTLPRPANLLRELQILEGLHLGDVLARPSVSQPFRNTMILLKANFQLSQNHGVYARFASQNNAQTDGAITSGRAQLACCSFLDDRHFDIYNPALSWTWVVSATKVNQLATQYTWFQSDDRFPPCDNCLTTRLIFPSVSTGQANALEHRLNQFKQIQVKDDFAWQIGRHALKVGADYQYLPLYGGIFAINSPGSIAFFDDPSVILNNTNGRYPQGFQTPGIVRSITVTPTALPPRFDIQNPWLFGTYLQDDFKVAPRLTLNLGLRYDVYELMNQPQLERSRIYQVLKAIGSSYGRLPQTDRNNLAPRLGVAWDLLGDGRRVLRGGYGVFYGEGTMNTWIQATLQMKDAVYFTRTLTNSALGSGPLANFVYGVSPLPEAPATPAPPALYPVGGRVGSADWYSPDFKEALTEQYHVGFSQLFSQSTVLAVDFTHNTLHNGWRSVDINPLLTNPSNPAGPLVRPLDAETLRVYGDANLLGPVSIQVAVNRARYDEIATHLERRFSASAGFQVNYTLAWARGMGGSVEGNRSFMGTFPPPQTASATGGDIYAPWEWGPTSYDERHRVTIAGVFTLPFDLDLSPSLTAATARPYTQYRAPSPSGDGNLQVLDASGNPAGINNARGKALINANARVTRNLRWSERKKASLFVELYNIFNRANFANSYGGNAFAPATYNKPTGYVGGIASTSSIPISFQLQVGARLAF